MMLENGPEMRLRLSTHAACGQASGSAERIATSNVKRLARSMHVYSVGHWEGDTLVVESTGFKDRTWLDMAGHPHTKTSARTAEMFTRALFW